MNNYINRFVQKSKSSLCEDKVFNDVMFNSTSATNIYHVRNETEIPAALVFKHEERVDDIIVYSLPEDDLQTGDYFIYRDDYFITGKRRRAVFADGRRDCFAALECNVTFTHNGELIHAAFIGALRKEEKLSSRQNTELSGFVYQNLQFANILIYPTFIGLKGGDRFIIDGNQWCIASVDSTSINGLSYATISYDIITADDKDEQPAPPIKEESQLKRGLEYDFATEDYYFDADCNCIIIDKNEHSVRIKIPFGIDKITIETKRLGKIVKTEYTVGV